MSIEKTKDEGVYKIDGKIVTKNLIPGSRSYGEKIFKEKGEEYRVWDPNRSKLAAAIKKNIEKVPIKKGSEVLYLGAAQGYTPSFVSDLVGKTGIVYCVEFSERAMRDLLKLCKLRENLIPILEDARKPQNYPWVGEVDVVYVDLAQPDQTEISIRNSEKFLKSYLMLAVKSRSIDVVKKPEKIYEEELGKLRDKGYKIIDWKKLDPFEKDHAFILAKKHE